MDKLLVTGPNTLRGEVTISAAKNATLPLLAATLLTPQEIIFEDVPQLNDISTLTKLLTSMGVKIKREKNQLHLQADEIHSQFADYQLVKTMRASVLVLGPLLARFGKAKVSLPGGCAIGARPVDIHLAGLEKMGAQIKIEEGYILAACPRLKGTTIHLSFPSVGATENLMMAAVFADGKTILDNAACEPEIVDLAHFLQALGVSVTGAGTPHIEIQGRSPVEASSLKATRFRPMGDRIEAATYIIAGLMCQSEITVKGFAPWTLEAVLQTLEKMGAQIERQTQAVKVKKSGRLKGTQIETAPFPGFPTDVQAQMMALMCLCEGPSVIVENIFENRFMHVPELQRLGCKISLKGSTAMIEGVERLSSAPIMCTDLRASAALVLASLCAHGTSDIQRIYHLDRGYEKLAEKFKLLGANIQRVKE